mmetsp:Transcript_13069/g.24215  ORF Transcript_13069/g.24215 Transcript_13069/m.24215 type:complete len:103 (-) Transcript_13069:744-1052(-)
MRRLRDLSRSASKSLSSKRALSCKAFIAEITAALRVEGAPPEYGEVCSFTLPLVLGKPVVLPTGESGLLTNSPPLWAASRPEVDASEDCGLELQFSCPKEVG